MNNILLFLAIIETVFIVMFADYNEIANLNLSLMYSNINFSISFFAFVILLYLFGIFAGILIMIPAILDSAKINKNAKRKLEAASVNKDENDIQISVLENKIKTLEAALDKALKKD